MSLNQILVFAAAALFYGPLFKGRGRGWFMLVASVLALYWLQPSTPIRNLDFWLPTASLAVTIIVWFATSPRPHPTTRLLDYSTLLVIAGLIVAVSLNRYIDYCCLTPTRPPEFFRVFLALTLLSALTFVTYRFRNYHLLIVVLLLLFFLLKTDPLAQALSAALRALNGQSAAQASALDIRWLGFSYLAFRLIHVLRERINGKLPELSLQEFLIYAVFFPALAAGPIDRVERFVKDLRAPFALATTDVFDGGWRLLWGIFKKFALADSLALIALNGVNAVQTTSPLWLWVLLYAYAFRLYFDFSGYTDIALGLGRLLGVKLPENFDRPYLKQNLTAFWNSWHITLAQWFRAYYFNPVTRTLRARAMSPALIIGFTQFSTMILIGLWHGVTWNFVAWGAWHGLGLFLHNRWADFTRPRAAMLDNRPLLKRAAAWGGVLLTFHYVTLGWVWFALPEIGLAGRVMFRLLGI
jgi:D-alanyl-lipoteichoic acid acyltransferase DltB (MBOAT superfamily)